MLFLLYLIVKTMSFFSELDYVSLIWRFFGILEVFWLCQISGTQGVCYGTIHVMVGWLILLVALTTARFWTSAKVYKGCSRSGYVIRWRISLKYGSDMTLISAASPINSRLKTIRMALLSDTEIFVCIMVDEG